MSLSAHNNSLLQFLVGPVVAGVISGKILSLRENVNYKTALPYGALIALASCATNLLSDILFSLYPEKDPKKEAMYLSFDVLVKSVMMGLNSTLINYFFFDRHFENNLNLFLYGFVGQAISNLPDLALGVIQVLTQ